jgi:hypothetical protein
MSSSSEEYYTIRLDGLPNPGEKVLCEIIDNKYMRVLGYGLVRPIPSLKFKNKELYQVGTKMLLRVYAINEKTGLIFFRDLH